MLTAVRVLNRDLGDVGRSSEHEIRMIHSILVAVGHANNKRLKWGKVKKFSDPGLHLTNLTYEPILVKSEDACWLLSSCRGRWIRSRSGTATAQ